MADRARAPDVPRVAPNCAFTVPRARALRARARFDALGARPLIDTPTESKVQGDVGRDAAKTRLGPSGTMTRSPCGIAQTRTSGEPALSQVGWHYAKKRLLRNARLQPAAMCTRGTGWCPSSISNTLKPGGPRLADPDM